jgi:hypothetical protein
MCVLNKRSKIARSKSFLLFSRHFTSLHKQLDNPIYYIINIFTSKLDLFYQRNQEDGRKPLLYLYTYIRMRGHFTNEAVILLCGKSLFQDWFYVFHLLRSLRSLSFTREKEKKS